MRPQRRDPARSIAPAPARRLSRLALTLLLSAAAAIMAAPAQEGERKLTPREDAEIRYADKLIQRGYQYLAGADWRRARKDFARAIESIASVYGEEHPRVAELYVVSARSRITAAMRRDGSNPAKGPLREAMAETRRAVDIYEALPPAQQGPLLETWLQYGDVSHIAGETAQATQTYLRAWQLLAESAGRRAANDYFSRPMALLDTKPRRGRKADEDRVVAFAFVIGGDGTVSEIEDRGSTAEERLTSRMRELLENARFRPRIVDGKLVPVVADVRVRFPADGSEPYDEPAGGA